jgi:hypothetical protein
MGDPIPVDVLHAPDAIVPTDHPIDQHPDRDAVIHAIGLYLLEPKATKPTWRIFVGALRTEFPDLALDATEERAIAQVQAYARKVARVVVLSGEFFRKALIEAGIDLNTLKHKADIAQKLQAEFEAVIADRSTDAKGRPNIRPIDRATLGRAALEAWNDFEETAERAGMLAPRHVKVDTTHVEIDVAALRAQHKDSYADRVRVR